VAFGQVVVLNGAPRSGKSTIAKALIDRIAAPWINLGVDVMQAATGERLLPGIGLRPGGERPDLEPFVVAAFGAMYAAVRSFSVAGVGVAVDIGHHDDYSQSLGLLGRSARQLVAVPVLFVGVRCPAEAVMARRKATWGDEGTGQTLKRVQRWEEAVHRPGIYDLEVDTDVMSPDECVDVIVRRIAEGPGTAFATAGGVGQTSQWPSDPGPMRFNEVTGA
jgi:chloramphenicol 3-O phosphotransferase